MTKTITPGSPLAAVKTTPDTSTKGAIKSTPPSSGSQLVTIGGKLVRQIDNCTVGDATTCHYGYCCTKKVEIHYIELNEFTNALSSSDALLTLTINFINVCIFTNLGAW